MASREELLLKAKGLATFADKFSAVPEGSLSEATNIVIDKDGLMSPRRGYETLANTSTLGYIESLHTFDDLVWVHRDATTTTADTLSYFSTANEVTAITTVADVADSLDGTFFIISDDLGTVAFWYDTDDSGTTIPAGAAAANRAIEITTVSTGDSAAVVGNLTYTAVIADEKFNAVSNDGAGIITIESSTEGNKTDATAETSGFTMNITTQGDDTWVDLTTSILTPTDVEKMRSIQFAKNIYFASDQGVQKLDDFSGDVIDSGAPEGIAPTAADSGAGSAIKASSVPGTNDVAVAYRIVWGYKDVNENLILGAPSSRTVFSHTLGTIRDVDLVIPIPPQIATNWFFQVYRSASLDYVAATPEIPSDELFLVFEGNPSSGEITAGTLTHSDSQPESLLGTALYTNATQEGILQSNFEPPKCRDMAIYQNHAFYANTETKYSQEFQLLSVGAPELQLTDTITINSDVYTVVSPGVKEVTSITARADVSDDLDATTFIMNDDLGTVGFWYDVDDSGTGIPAAASGANRAVEITTIVTNDTAATVGTKTLAAIVADLSFETVSDDLAGIIVCRATTFGTKTDSIASTSGFTVSTPTQGVATPALSAGDFALSDSLSVFAAIEETAKELVRAVNEDTRTSDIIAYYDSDTSPTSTDLPGKIRVTESDFAVAAAFTVSATASGTTADIWLPDLGTTQTSTNEAKPNRISFSKELQAESVPINNFFDVGAANDKILRILPLRTALLIFTEAGIYRLTGVSQSSFQVTLLDNTAKMIAPDSAVVLENNVYGLFDQGVCKVSDSVVVLSRPIEGQLLTIRGAIGNTMKQTFGIGYESDRKYMMFISTTEANLTPNRTYVYNVVTETWTTYDLNKKHGIVNPVDDRVYLCAEDNVAKERKDFLDSDIADEQIEFTPSSVTNNLITVPSSVALAARVGDLFYQTDTRFSLITAIDTGTDVLTLEDTLAYTTDPSEIRKFIATKVVWNPVFADRPSTLKQFSEVTLLTSKPVRSSDLGFSTIQSPAVETVSISSGSGGAWGLFGWGEVNWGGEVSITSYRTYVPRLKQRDAALILQITQNTVYDNFEISGFSLIYRMIGSRTGR